MSTTSPACLELSSSVLPGSPWTDIRLRKASNLAIDRDAVVGLMNGLQAR